MPLATVTTTASSRVPNDVDLLVVPVFSDGTTPAGVGVTLDALHLAARGFEGKAGEVLALLADDGSTVLAVGVGAAAEVHPGGLRRAAALAVRASAKATSVGVALALAAPRHAQAAATQAVTEGALLGSYTFTAFKSTSTAKPLATLRIVGPAAAVRTGVVVATAQALARDLVNEPPGTATPSRLAGVAVDLAAAASNRITVEVWDEERIAAERCGGLLGVSLGSDEPPRLVTMSYEPDGADDTTPTVCLVGKGITFDSGGLSLKTGPGMMTMKCDMGGAAAVLGTFSALAATAVPVRVVGYVCATENLPGPKAIKPGDVLRFRNGKTAEVLNTDAEGRLVLADGLSLAAERSPAAIVDLATLTGACMVALGPDIVGMMGTSVELIDQIEKAAEIAGEHVWQLPLPARYRKMIDSPIADMKNIGGPHGGAITAGLFLKEFAGEGPWVHLDIAGPAFVEADDADISKGGTGVMVRTLLTMLATFTAPG